MAKTIFVGVAVSVAVLTFCLLITTTTISDNERRESSLQTVAPTAALTPLPQAQPKPVQLKAKSAKTKLDTSGQAKLVKHPFVQYVNDVDEGLNESLEKIRKHEALDSAAPLPPRYHSHHPYGVSHHLDAVPMPPMDAVPNMNGRSYSSYNDDDDDYSEPLPIAGKKKLVIHLQTPQDINKARTIIINGVKQLKKYTKRFAKKHSIMKRIHKHETEVHDRLRFVQQQQKHERAREEAVDNHQDLVRHHEMIVAMAQNEVAEREARLAKRLHMRSRALNAQQRLLDAKARNKFDKIVQVEENILKKIQHGAFLEPPASVKGHHVHVNVNSPGGKAAPVHVVVHARQLGENGDIQVNINRDLDGAKHNEDEDAQKPVPRQRTIDSSNDETYSYSNILKSLKKIDGLISESNTAAEKVDEKAKTVAALQKPK